MSDKTRYSLTLGGTEYRLTLPELRKALEGSGLAVLAVAAVPDREPPDGKALLGRCRDHLDAFLDYCEGNHLPSEQRAKRLWVAVNDAIGDAVDHATGTSPLRPGESGYRESLAPVAAPCPGCAAARKLLTWGKNECEPAVSDFPEAAEQWLKEHP